MKITALKKIVLVITGGLLFSLAGVAYGTESITLGMNLSLSGPREAAGLSTRSGAEMLKEEINSEGGLLVGGTRYPVNLIYVDNETSLEKAVSGALKLISQDKVLGVVGPNSSSRAIPVGGISQSFRTVMVSPTSTNPRTTKNRPYIFRACFLDDFQGEVMAKFAVKEFNAKKAAVLFDSESAYPKGLAEFFKGAFEKLQGYGATVAYESFKSNPSNLSGQLRNIVSSDADVLFVPQYSNELPQILKQVRAAGWKKPILGGDAWESSDLMQKCGDLCKGLFFSAHFGVYGAEGKAEEFIKRYNTKYQKMPDGYAALGYDAANLLLTAISNLDVVNKNLFKAREDVMVKIAEIKEFEGVSGVLNMNASGDPSKSAVVIRINEKGEFESYGVEHP